MNTLAGHTHAPISSIYEKNMAVSAFKLAFDAISKGDDGKNKCNYFTLKEHQMPVIVNDNIHFNVEMYL